MCCTSLDFLTLWCLRAFCYNLLKEPATACVCNHNVLVAGRRGKNVKSKYKAVVGCTIDVPAPIFGVDIPDLYYRGTVLKKDPAHAGKHLLI